MIEGLAVTYEAAEGSGVFIGPLTVTNQSPATGITGTLSVAADGFLGEPVVSPAGDVSLAPGEARQFSIFLPIGTAGTPPGDYIMDVSFEGATFSTAAITIIEPVGTVTEITGVVNVQPADGEMRALGLGDPIFANDTIITGAGAMARIEFADESSFEVFENAKLAIDDYVYDPEASANNRVDFSILRGVFLFTSGLIGRDDPDNINIDTPHGGIGIRGTEFTVDVSDDGTNSLIEIEVTEGTVVFTDFYTGEVTEIPAGESHQSTAPLPSLETVRLSVNRVGDPALDLAGYTDAAFTVQRSTDLKTWDDWREVQASELPLSIPETSGEDAVFYRLAR
ncbi:MAG: FecR family protein [Verrucomicrobiales bacterium]